MFSRLLCLQQSRARAASEPVMMMISMQSNQAALSEAVEPLRELQEKEQLSSSSSRHLSLSLTPRNIIPNPEELQHDIYSSAHPRATNALFPLPLPLATS